MKKTFAALALGLTLATTSCSAFSNWWSDVKNNPAIVVQQFDAVVQTILNDIEIAWTAVQPFIPTQTLPAVTTAYQQALTSVNHAVAALNSAVQAASDAQQSNPDFSALMKDVGAAVNQVIAIVDQYGGHVVAPGALGVSTAVPGLSDAHTGVTSLARWTH